MEVETQIKAIMPAPGWRAFCCIIEESGEFLCLEESVVGWGLVEKQYSEDKETTVELLFHDKSYGVVSVRDPVLDSANSDMFILSPRRELDDELKKEWETDLRRSVAAKEEHRQRQIRKMLDLDARGYSVSEIAQMTHEPKPYVDMMIHNHKKKTEAA
jgi:hypothetical protein